MTADCDQRHTHQEAAFLALLEQVHALDTALRFEVSQRETMEQLLMKLAGLQGRMDRAEREIRHLRKKRSLPPEVSE